MTTTLTEQEFVDALTTGTIWTAERIEQHLREMAADTAALWGIQGGVDGGIYYLYANECYLTVMRDGEVTVRNDRETGLYANSSWEYVIDSKRSLEAAFDDFKTCTVDEDEE